MLRATAQAGSRWSRRPGTAVFASALAFQRCRAAFHVARKHQVPRSQLLPRAAAVASSSSSPPAPPPAQQQHNKHRLVFLGTPEPAASVLRSLIEASKQPSSNFEVSAVVSQPPKAQGRGRKAAPPSPVAAAAAEAGFVDFSPSLSPSPSPSPSPSSGTPRKPLFSGEQKLLLCPASPRDEAFLETIERLKPSLCVTVAYGGLLTSRFLGIPSKGTLNVHPSLLPRWRGAAPVQRTLAAGDEECGVSLAYTVLALDAGPVLASERMETPPRATAPELLSLLMSKGGELLLKELPRVLSGEATQEKATPQSEIEAREEGEGAGGGEAIPFATHAARLTRDDGRINPFDETLRESFNKWRSAFGWPGGWIVVRVEGEDEEDKEIRLESASPLFFSDDEDEDEQERERKTAAAKNAFASFPPPPGALAVTKEHLLISCADGGILVVSEVKPAGRKKMTAGAWANGLGGKKVVAVKKKKDLE